MPREHNSLRQPAYLHLIVLGRCTYDSGPGNTTGILTIAVHNLIIHINGIITFQPSADHLNPLFQIILLDYKAIYCIGIADAFCHFNGGHEI